MAGRCPYCDDVITPEKGGRSVSSSRFADVWVCPECDRILGVSDWKDTPITY